MGFFCEECKAVTRDLCVCGACLKAPGRYVEACEKLHLDNIILKDALLEIMETSDYKFCDEKTNGKVTYHTSYLRSIAKEALEKTYE